MAPAQGSARVPASCVFATTRPDNISMIRLLLALGFVRAGKPYPHTRRNEELVLFLRARPTFGALSRSVVRQEMDAMKATHGNGK
jgi:hypothetical protein